MSNEITSTLTSILSNTARTTTMNRNNHEVRIWVERDEDANRISAVLEALGYSVLRELEEGDAPSRLRWAVERLARRHKLTIREQDILERVLAGRNNDEISRDLEISRATVKWHMHNVFAKTNTGNRESLLRLALQLGGVRESELDAATLDELVGQIEIEDLVAEDHVQVRESDIVTEAIPAAAVPSKSWY